MTKSIKSKLITLFAVLLSVCMLFSVATMTNLTAKAEGTTTAATLVEGASVRVNSAESSGLKFKAQLDKTQYNALYNQAGGALKAGMIIVPTDYIEAAGGGYTFNAFADANKTIAANTVDEFKDASDSTYEFTMSIINLKVANYDRDFEAIVYLESDVALDGFIAYGEKYYAYAERNVNCARNIYEVAKGVYNDRADAKDETKYVYEVDGKYATVDSTQMGYVKTFIDGVTEIVLEDGKPAAYSSEYYAANANVLTNDTEAYLMGEHKNVVYNGESVTSYPYTADGIAIKEMYTNGATYADGAYTMASNGVAITGASINSLGLDTSCATYGYVAFNGAYGPSNYVEFTFTGNNMPQVILFSDNVESNNFTRAGGRGMAFINGVTTDGGTSGNMINFQVYGPMRVNQHYPAYAAYRQANTSAAPTMQYFINNPDTEFRYVIGTYIVKEDVHNASGVIYGADEEKDGILENVVYFDLYLYNNETGAQITHITSALKPSNTAGITDYVATANTEYLLAEDFVDGGIMAYPSFKGMDADGNIFTSTFKVTKAPYHVHNYNSEIQSDAAGHWYECACGEKNNVEEHTGGTATHTEKATCEVCGTQYGDLRANYDVDDVTLNQMTNVSASEVISATKGSITFTPSQATPSQNSTSNIVLEQQFTNEFVMIEFKALADYVKEGDVTNISDVLGLSVEYRTSSLTSNHAYDQWGITPVNSTNYFNLYSKSSGNYYCWPTTRTVAKALTADTTYYLIAGITETDGERTLYYYILDESNTVMAKAVATEANITTAETNKSTSTLDNALAESGYWTINSWATTERTLSYEVISEAQAMYYINGGTGVEDLAVSGNTASWTAFTGATSYKVSIDGNEYVTDATSYAIPDLTAFDTYTVSVKAVCDGFETKAEEVTFQYVPADLAFANVDMSTIKADGEISANKGTVTMTGSSAAIVLNDSFDTQFVKVGFTAAATYDSANSVYWNKAAALAIGFRRTASQTGSGDSWALSSWGNANNLYITNSDKNGVIGGGFTTASAGSASLNSIVEGEKYYMLFGVTGTTNTDRVFHILWLDENDTVLVYYALAQSERPGIAELEMADAGCFTIHSVVEGERTISWEIIEAEDVFKNANFGTFTATNSGATVSWSAVDGATGYAVRVNGGEWIDVADATSYTIPNAVSFANYEVEVLANKGYYSAVATCNFVNTPAGIEVLNMTNISTTNGVSTTKGDITFTANNLSADFKSAATVVLDGNYTNEFIKVKFTALESGTGRTYMPNQTLGLAIGVRGVSSDNIYTNLAFVPYNNTNWAALFGYGAYLKHSGGIGSGTTYKHWDNIVKGTTYYMVTGIVGSDYNKTTETTDDDAVFYWMLLDEDNTLRVTKIITAEQLLAIKSNATIAESGAFTIHSMNTVEEREISYEIIDSATALGYLG